MDVRLGRIALLSTNILHGVSYDDEDMIYSTLYYKWKIPRLERNRSTLSMYHDELKQKQFQLSCIARLASVNPGSDEGWTAWYTL